MGTLPSRARRQGSASESGRGQRPEREDLEVERDFLLRSLQDLKRNIASVMLSDEDYTRLHDSYTVRAAEVLRALRSGEHDGDLEKEDAAADGDPEATKAMLSPRIRRRDL